MFDIETKTKNYMSVVVTHVCNQCHPFCIDSYKGSNEFIKQETIDNAIRFATHHHIKDILLVGGEPTLHPEITLIAHKFKVSGFNVILTTNYSIPEVVKALDGVVDSFNISYYGQLVLPVQSEFMSDITLSALIYKGQLDTLAELNDFISQWGARLHLKFSTLTVVNEWTKIRQHVDYLDELVCRKVVLFDEILGQIYRGTIIKRYDKLINRYSYQSYKCHVDGEISQSWVRSNKG